MEHTPGEKAMISNDHRKHMDRLTKLNRLRAVNAKLLVALEQIRVVAENEPTIDRTFITIQRTARAAIEQARKGD